jgi:hypothetical protein
MHTGGDQDAKRIESSMTTAYSAQSAASVAFRQADEHRETAEKAATLESKFGINFANAFGVWLNRYHPGVIGPNRNPSDERMADLGAEFIRDSVVVKNADNTFKMVQRSEMGVMTITPGSHKEAELKARLGATELGSPRVAANDAAALDAGRAANDRQVLGSGRIGADTNGTAPQSASAAQARYDAHMAEMQAKIKAAGATVSGAASKAHEEFKIRANETHPMQNLGRTPWSDHGALEQLEKDADGKKADTAKPTEPHSPVAPRFGHRSRFEKDTQSTPSPTTNKKGT